MPLRLWGLVAGLLLVAVSACTGSDGGDERSASPRGKATSESPGRTASPTPATHPVSIPALIARKHTGSALRLGDVLARNSAYTRYAVTYRANGLRISGVLNIPRGDGPFPALVLAHGYADVRTYVSGRGTLDREQDLLARNGYVVLHTDYRNHAGSDDDPDNDMSLRLGYTEDVIGAVKALRSSGRAEIDGDRIGLLGRSMGGGVVYNTLVAAPGLVDAAVAYAPVSGRPAENIDQFQRRNGDPLVKRIDTEYGTPKSNPKFWREASPLTYADRIKDPLLIHHGTRDTSCPVRWSREAASVFEKAGKDVQLREYEGEGHVFGARWRTSIDRTMAFFKANLR
ncbi:alpha/beta fold hydrolase [Streptomyces sp. A7024]|uniref:Alpha/beta fold hydrolase n=1 Tax=Streptomyces coryli TaxID=1128680 RepID=A0A6G4U7F5_9ACTN|nr:alpha/beta fold hydrolase [Streptomyces coryli]NGN68114.1 alpha/beta fold hydrolase [Streptomyces coryli]